MIAHSLEYLKIYKVCISSPKIHANTLIFNKQYQNLSKVKAAHLTHLSQLNPPKSSNECSRSDVSNAYLTPLLLLPYLLPQRTGVM